MKLLRRILLSLLLLLLIVIVSAAGYVTSLIRAGYPQTAGKVLVPGLTGQVDVYRDSWGIPQIFADSPHDLFFAQGYVHAQDRFWQMEFWRRIGAGRLSEIFGSATLNTDRFIRTLGWNRVAKAEAELLLPEERAVLQAYADGVNAYIASHGDHLGLEFELLKVQGVTWNIEPWTIENTLTWGKAMAWDLGEGQLDLELLRANVIAAVGAEKTAEIFPNYPTDHPTIINEALSPGDLTPLVNVSQDLTELLAADGMSIGSNSWVVAPEKTANGRPLLANDMHLGIQMPAIWYEAGLHCRTLSETCPYDVVGVTFPGTPGVVVGHNSRIAWAFTNVDPDVVDLYLEETDPNNPTAAPITETLTETIVVRGKIEPEPEDYNQDIGTYDPASDTTTLNLPVRYTQHGPIIHAVSKASREYVAEQSNHYEIAMQWTALQPGRVVAAILGLNRASNFDEFHAALADFSAPSQNVLYADVDGNIGYQTPGLIPLRQGNRASAEPVPGSDPAYDWQGFIPYEDLPRQYNPAQGYIVAANNAIVDDNYPYHITNDWDPGYRAERIDELIRTAPAPIDIAYYQQMHMDSKNLMAMQILPALQGMQLSDPAMQAALDELLAWDYQQSSESGMAALYNIFWVRLLENTYYDELPVGARPDNKRTTFVWFADLIQQEQATWWDDVTTAPTESRTEVLRVSFEEAYQEAVRLMGAERAKWQWGTLHTALFRHATLGSSGIAPIEAIFNRGPLPMSGGSSIVNATGWRIAENDDGSTSYALTALPSMRLIVDVGAWDNTQNVNTVGQSGHPYHANYGDQIADWQSGGYHSLPFSLSAVQANHPLHLILVGE
jgi:penicillin amidase